MKTTLRKVANESANYQIVVRGEGSGPARKKEDSMKNTIVITISMPKKELKEINDFLKVYRGGVMQGQRSKFLIHAALEKAAQIKAKIKGWKEA